MKEFFGIPPSAEFLFLVKFGDRATNLPVSVSVNGSTISYHYDEKGNIQEILEDGEITARYTYDTLGRLIREDCRALSKTERTVYDTAGNILLRFVYPFTLGEINNCTPTKELRYTYASENGTAAFPHKLMTSFDGEACAYDAIGNPTTYRGEMVAWQNARLLLFFKGAIYQYDNMDRCTFMGGDDLKYDHTGRVISAKGLRILYDESGILGLRDASDNFYYAKKDAQGKNTPHTWLIRSEFAKQTEP